MNLIFLGRSKTVKRIISTVCNEHNYDCKYVQSYRELIIILRELSENIDAIIVYEVLSGSKNGLETVRFLNSLYPTVRILFLARTNSIGFQAMTEGAQRYCVLPFNKDEITFMIQTLVAEGNVLSDALDELNQLRHSHDKNFPIASENVINKEAIYKFLEDALHLVSCFWTSIVLFDTQQKAYFFAQAGLKDAYPLNVIRNNGLSRQIVESGKSLFVEDLQSNTEMSRKVNKITHETGARSIAGILLYHNNRKIGVLWFHYSTPQKFSETDVSVLELFAEEFAHSYYLSYIEQQLGFKLQDGVKQSFILNSLLNASRTIISQKSVSETLMEVCKQTYDIIQLVSEGMSVNKECIVILSMLRQSPLRIEAKATYPSNVLDLFSDSQTKTLYLDAMSQSGIVSKIIGSSDNYLYVKNTLEEANYLPIPSRFLSHLSVRLTIRNETIGILTLEARPQDAFDASEIEIVQFISGLAASAIEIARQADEREEYIQDVTHQLVGPLGGIRNWIEYLLEVSMIFDLQKTYLKRIFHLAGRVQRYALNFAYSSLENEGQLIEVFAKGSQGINHADLIQILIENAQSFQGEARARKITGPNVIVNTFQDFPLLELQLDLFEILILNLYDNALKYSYDNTEITIKGKTIDSEVQIEVTNYGIPLAEKEIPKIFQRRVRTDEAIEFAPTGTGIGLFISRQIARVHGGDLTAIPSTTKNRTSGNKVTFVLKLPIKIQNHSRR